MERGTPRHNKNVYSHDHEYYLFMAIAQYSSRIEIYCIFETAKYIIYSLLLWSAERRHWNENNFSDQNAGKKWVEKLNFRCFKNFLRVSPVGRDQYLKVVYRRIGIKKSQGQLFRTG